MFTSRRVALSCFVLSVLFSGAVQSAPAGLIATGCEEQELSVLYPSAPLKKLLPAGFKLVSVDPAGLLAAIDISIDRCAAVNGGSGGEDFLAFVEVVPPAQYQQADLAAYGLLLELWSTRPQTVDAFTAWGFGRQAAAGQVDFKTALDLLGREIGTVKVQSGGGKLVALTAFGAQKSVYPAGATRAFAQDASGHLHILDASWSDQTFQYGVGTLTQTGSGPLLLPLPVQVYPVLAAHATDYSLVLQPIQ